MPDRRSEFAMRVLEILDSDQHQDEAVDSLPGPDPLFKPCPFCGWTEPRMLTVESDADFADDFSVQCLECGACGGNRDNQTDAAIAWNARSCDHRDETDEIRATLETQRPIVREASTLRAEFDKHERKECGCPTLRECAAHLYVLARKVWPVRPSAILIDEGRGA